MLGAYTHFDTEDLATAYGIIMEDHMFTGASVVCYKALLSCLRFSCRGVKHKL
jgi:hypothetical protein